MYKKLVVYKSKPCKTFLGHNFFSVDPLKAELPYTVHPSNCQFVSEIVVKLSVVKLSNFSISRKQMIRFKLTHPCFGHFWLFYAKKNNISHNSQNF